MGAVAVPGVPDQSDCSFTDDPLSTGSTCPRPPCEPPYKPSTNAQAPFATNFSWGPRCFYHEDWAGSDMWVVQDELVPILSTGVHYVSSHSSG